MLLIGSHVGFKKDNRKNEKRDIKQNRIKYKE